MNYGLAAKTADLNPKRKRTTGVLKKSRKQYFFKGQGKKLKKLGQYVCTLQPSIP